MSRQQSLRIEKWGAFLGAVGTATCLIVGFPICAAILSFLTGACALAALVDSI